VNSYVCQPGLIGIKALKPYAKVTGFLRF